MKKHILTLIMVMAMTSAAFAQKPEHTFELSKNLDIFNSMYRQLDIFYVDSLEADKMLRIGINSMLKSLDPYTVYYPEEEMDKLKTLTTGKYGGIGSVIRQRKDSTVIIYEPYAGSPSAEAGLKVGDVLLKIDNNDLKGMNTSEVSELLRGEPGTSFVLKAQRPGEKKPREFRITRNVIKFPAIPYYGLVGNGNVGYISFSEFTEGCAKDVRKAIITMKEKGAKSIVIDLRDNGGGLLSEAVDIVNLFIPKGKPIVELRGKIKAANNSYSTNNEPLDTIIPLAVLVNGNTASSSEILSGSLQDFDRAVILGSKTYGKGLVQSTRELPYNGGIKLTTAKYYIPSGRCIQAIDYKQLRQKAEADSNGKKAEATDSIKHIFHTAAGREVTEGQGIKPDIELKHDTLANFIFYLSNDDVLIDWGTKYCQQHPTIPAARDFEITDADFQDFKQMIKDSGFTFDRISEERYKALVEAAKFEGYYDDAKDAFDALEKKLAHNLDREFAKHEKDVRNLMAAEVLKRYYFQAGTIEQSLKFDEDLNKAIEILNNADEYNKILKP